MDSGLTGYRETVDELFARTGSTSRLGLERVGALLELLGNPHRSLKIFHVAGTNGKGSVVATIGALLESKGMRVGRYTSPHLMDFRERIVVNGAEIAAENVVEFIRRWERATERLGATFFEITTAMAFQHFADCEVDVAVIETGLGGRLDATNVVAPLAAGITSISVDHTEYLGNGIRQIAVEKAGIFKPGVPAIVGRVPPEARKAISEAADRQGVARLVDATELFATGNVSVTPGGTDFSIEHAGRRARLMTGLVGTPQADNAAVALAMLSEAGAPWAVTVEAASAVLPSVQLPGRFQRIGQFVLDVAHNADAIRAVAATLKALDPPRPIVAVVGILGDKNWREMLDVLSGSVDAMLLTAPPSAPAQRAWNLKEALAYAASRGWAARSEPDLAAALDQAGDQANTVLVTGSFYTVGDAMQICLGLARRPAHP